MSRVARWLAAVTLGAVLVGAAPHVAPARVRATNVAGVTVAFGDGRVVRRTVSFTADSISGLDALRQAGFEVEVYGYSGLGAAVCRIDGVGRAPDSACLNGGTEYWAYWRDGVYSRAGAGGTRVADGDQEQWAWGTGTAAPPTTAFPTPTTAPPPPPPTQPPATPSSAPSGQSEPGGGQGGPEDGGPSTTSPSSTTSSPASSTVSSTGPSRPAGGGEDPDDGAGDSEAAAGRLTSSTGPARDDDGGGSPLALAGFGVVLAAVVALTLKARSARGTAPPRN